MNNGADNGAGDGAAPGLGGGGGDEDGDGGGAPQVPVLAIQGLEHYFRSRAIGEREDNERQDRENLAREAEQQTEDARRYQDEVHRRIFGEEEDPKYTDVGGGLGCIERTLCKDVGEMSVLIRTSDGRERTLPLEPLARSCDFFCGMASYASSRPLITEVANESSPSLPPSSPRRKKRRERPPMLELSLSDFDSSAVEGFLSVALREQSARDLHPDVVVECFRLAHYLQCPSAMEDIVPILVDSIDSDNCMSMCQLADQLNIPSLYETAVNHMLMALDDMEKHEVWDADESEGGMPKNLKVRILTMRNAVRSSLLARGSSAVGVFFSCGDEFLAILSDNLREQKERLAEAKLRQREVVEERLENRAARRGSRRVGVDPEDLIATGCQLWKSVRDAQQKIEQQERRIETLETFYREQKTIFESAGWLKERGDNGFML